MTDSNSVISIIALNFNEINTSIKRHRLSDRKEQGLPKDALSVELCFTKTEIVWKLINLKNAIINSYLRPTISFKNFSYYINCTIVIFFFFSCLIVSSSLWPHLYSSWNSPGQNTGVSSLSLLQGIFPTQGWNPGLPQHRWIFYQLSYQRS